MNIVTQFFSKNPQRRTKQSVEQDLIRRESVLSQGIFGKVPDGGSREFFCLDENTWIWYEEWISDAGEKKQMTTRYVVRPREILKSQNGGAYHKLTIEEAENFKKAVDTYVKNAKSGLYDKLRAKHA